MFKLSTEELAIVKQTSEKVEKMIKSQDTTSVSAVLNSIDTNEMAWIRWKNLKCQNYELPPDLTLKNKLDQRRQAKLELKQNNR